MNQRCHLLSVIVTAVVVALCFSSCSDGGGCDSDMETLLDTIATGTDDEITALHWKGEEISPEARSIGVRGMKSLRPPTDSDHIKIRKKFVSGAYTLLVLEVSWEVPANPTGFLPLLVRQDNGGKKVAGLMLPFNDIIPLIPESEAGDYQALSMEWVGWISSNR